MDPNVVDEASVALAAAVDAGLMQVALASRAGKRVVLRTAGGPREVVEFINCSYLGLDTRDDVVAGAVDAVRRWGVHLCCARSRFTIGDNADLEAELSRLWGARAITFPSVTSAHLAALPLVASGALLPRALRRDPTRADARVRLIFDRFAHTSMQQLKPILREHATVVTVGHNDIDAVRVHVDAAAAAGEDAVVVADSVYSMGGRAPLAALLTLAEERGAFLYLDDAHGTSIFGARGEGAVLASTSTLPARALVTFSLAKGFGANGGGILVPSAEQEARIRSFGTSYAFSTPLDFSIVGAARAALRLHEDGTVLQLQARLRDRVALFDTLARPLRADDDRAAAADDDDDDGFSPIRMVPLRDHAHGIAVGRALIERGYFVSVALYPVVPRDQPQLRVCLAVDHSDDDIAGLCRALVDVGAGARAER